MALVRVDASTSDGNRQLLRAIKPITVPWEGRGPGKPGRDDEDHLDLTTYKVPQGKPVRRNDVNGRRDIYLKATRRS